MVRRIIKYKTKVGRSILKHEEILEGSERTINTYIYCLKRMNFIFEIKEGSK